MGECHRPGRAQCNRREFRWRGESAGAASRVGWRLSELPSVAQEFQTQRTPLSLRAVGQAAAYASVHLPTDVQLEADIGMVAHNACLYAVAACDPNAVRACTSQRVQNIGECPALPEDLRQRFAECPP